MPKNTGYLLFFSLEILSAEWIIDVVRDGDDIDPYVIFLYIKHCYLLVQTLGPILSPYLPGSPGQDRIT